MVRGIYDAFGCQSSSAVEQRTHKPLVGGSIPSSGTSLNVCLRLYVALQIRPLLLRFYQRPLSPYRATWSRPHGDDCKGCTMGIGRQPGNGFFGKCPHSGTHFQKVEEPEARFGMVQPRRSNGGLSGIEQPRHNVSGLVGGSIPSSGTSLNPSLLIIILLVILKHPSPITIKGRIKIMILQKRLGQRAEYL